jgi:ABC-type transport system involved in Fe-S cluster assembly fused permease/ATPase subunit
MKTQPLSSLLPILVKLARSPKLLVVAAIIVLVEKSANVLIAVSLKEIIDTLDAVAADFRLAVLLVVGYGALRVIAPILAEVRDLLFTKVSENIARETSQEVSAHLLELGESFHSLHSSGAIARDIDRGTNGVSFALRYLLFSGIPTLLEISLILVVMAFLLTPIYSAVALIGILLYFTTSYKGNEWRSQYIKEVNKLNSEAGANLTECFLNHQTIDLYNLTPWSIRRIGATLKKWVSARVNDRRSLAAVTSLQAVVISATLTALLLFGTRDVLQKSMSTGEFVMLTVFTAQLFAPLNLLGFVYKEMRQSIADIEQMYRYLCFAPEVDRTSGEAKPTFPFRSFELRNVRFQYFGSHSLLKNLTMTFSAGQRVAIVGPSGSGKSTIAKLLVRSYDPLDGAVLLNGIDLRQLDLTALRNGIGIVTQDTSLFNMTLAENIALGLPGASKQQVEDAAKQAGLTDLVSSLPLGLDASVGERGSLLSGGERQRIGLARALIRRPSLLILDEATASLDNVSEAGILRALSENVAEATTTVTIAHRLSTVVDADIIYVMANGVIVESGKHEQLLLLNGLYHALWSSQRQTHCHSPQSSAKANPES